MNHSTIDGNNREFGYVRHGLPSILDAQEFQRRMHKIKADTLCELIGVRSVQQICFKSEKGCIDQERV
jgi:hypothetical protein